MLTFHSDSEKHDGQECPSLLAAREYETVICGGCGQRNDAALAEFMRESVLTEHGLLVGSTWCALCGRVQPMLLRTVDDPASLRGGVAVERL